MVRITGEPGICLGPRPASLAAAGDPPADLAGPPLARSIRVPAWRWSASPSGGGCWARVAGRGGARGDPARPRPAGHRRERDRAQAARRLGCADHRDLGACPRDPGRTARTFVCGSGRSRSTSFATSSAANGLRLQRTPKQHDLLRGRSAPARWSTIAGSPGGLGTRVCRGRGLAAGRHRPAAPQAGARPRRNGTDRDRARRRYRLRDDLI